MTTVKLERWRGHIAAARKQGMALSCYAREHGISRYTLYAAQRRLRSEGEATAKRARQSVPAFVPVEVTGSAPTAVRARLPNGVQLEFGHLDASACATLVGMLAALSCSG